MVAALGFQVWRVLAAAPGVFVHANSRRYAITISVLFVAGVAWIGVSLTAARSAVEWLSRRSTTRTWPVTADMALEFARGRWPVVRTTAALVSCVIVAAALTQTFIAWLDATIDLTGGANRTAYVDLPPGHSGSAGVPELVGDVDVRISIPITSEGRIVAIEAVACSPAAGPRCDPRGRVSPALAGAVLTVDMADGASHPVTTRGLYTDPALTDSPVEAVVDLRTHPWIWNAANRNIQMVAPRDSTGLSEAIGRIRERYPTATIQTGEDTELLALIREQNLMLRVGVATTAMFAAGALALLAWETARQTRRSRNALVAAGAPQHFLRSTHTLSLLIPAAVAALPTAAGMSIGAASMLANFGTAYLTSAPLAWTFVPACVLCLAVAFAGWITGGHRFDRGLAGV